MFLYNIAKYFLHKNTVLHAPVDSILFLRLTSAFFHEKSRTNNGSFLLFPVQFGVLDHESESL